MRLYLACRISHSLKLDALRCLPLVRYARYDIGYVQVLRPEVDKLTAVMLFYESAVQASLP